VIARRIIVEGRVQGVGYRAFVARQAESRGLTGWVRNLSDGNVEAVLCGTEADAVTVIEACRRGPRLAIVRRLTEEACAEDTWAGFAVRPTE